MTANYSNNYGFIINESEATLVKLIEFDDSFRGDGENEE